MKEYKIFNTKYEVEENTLNANSRAGWDLHSFNTKILNGNTIGYIYIFVKEI